MFPENFENRSSFCLYPCHFELKIKIYFRSSKSLTTFFSCLKFIILISLRVFEYASLHGWSLHFLSEREILFSYKTELRVQCLHGKYTVGMLWGEFILCSRGKSIYVFMYSTYSQYSIYWFSYSNYSRCRLIPKFEIFCQLKINTHKT
jgi:hypothetical protein